MSNHDAADGEDDSRCDFCQLRFPEGAVAAGRAVTRARDGVVYRFCSNACAETLDDQERVFTEYHGARYVETGVSAIDKSLPQGLPRNSFVLFSGQSGTRDEAVLAELVWRALERGEPAVVVSYLNTPTSVVQTFVDLNWNVLPYLESGALHVLDCFTYRLDSPQRTADRLNDWNQHLRRVAASATTSVGDPTNVPAVLSQLDVCLDSLGMHDEGIVVIDSLTELGSLVQPVKAYDFVKNVRAEVSKGRFVSVFAHATRVTEEVRFPHDLSYMVDGLVDFRFDEETVPDTLLKQLRVRKTSGVLAIPEWHTYEFTGGTGMVVFDPEAEIEKSRQRRDDASAGPGPNGHDQEPAGGGNDGGGESGATDDDDGRPGSNGAS